MASLREHMKRHSKALKRQKSASSPAVKDDFTVGEGWAEGWISPAVVDRAGEYVPPDEWNLAEHKKNPVGFINHNRNEIPPLRWEHPDGKYSVEQRAEGLYGRAYFNLATKTGQDAYASFKSGHLRGFSAGFNSNRPVRGTVGGRPAHILRKADVFEISAVGVPENQDAIRVRVKSAADAAGNYPIPDGKVQRFGVFAMADEIKTDPATATVVNEKQLKPGFPGFLDVMVSGLKSVFADAKVCLKDVPEDERNEAFSLAGPTYVCAKSLCEAGRAKFKDMPWDDAEKAIETEFAGFGDALKAQETEDDAVTQEHLKSLVAETVAEQLKPFAADVTEIKGHVDNHEVALVGLTEVVESTLAS